MSKRVLIWISLTAIVATGAAYWVLQLSHRGAPVVGELILGLALAGILAGLLRLQNQAGSDRESSFRQGEAIKAMMAKLIADQQSNEIRVAATLERFVARAAEEGRRTASPEVVEEIIERTLVRQRQSATVPWSPISPLIQNRFSQNNALLAFNREPNKRTRFGSTLDDFDLQHLMVTEPGMPRFGAQSELAHDAQVSMQTSLEFSKLLTRNQPALSCEYRVWFATDRRPNSDGDYTLGFSDEFSDSVKYGSCVVYIPKSHEYGSIGSNYLTRIVRSIAGKSSDEPLKLLAVEAGVAESFVNDLRSSLSTLEPNQRDLTLFIHGYNVDFDSAAIRSAQIGRDLQLPGPMIFYSWPSKAQAQGYLADEETIGRTLMKFVRFLQLLNAIPEMAALNVIAHSMGNRLLQRAMQILSFRDQATDKRFGHVIIAAADIDRETFREAAVDYARLKAAPTERTAVYFNKSDVAVSLSTWLHEEARLGTQGNAFSNVDSILWIDKFFSLDWLGHGYFGSATPVLQDMKALLVDDKTPMQRQPPLSPIPSDVPQYWELRA